MSLIRISGPPDLVVSLAEAKAQLRLDDEEVGTSAPPRIGSTAPAPGSVGA